MNSTIKINNHMNIVWDEDMGQFFSRKIKKNSKFYIVSIYERQFFYTQEIGTHNSIFLYAPESNIIYTCIIK